tara:strand:- start:39 stop:542 length:504 start_codon:yes stop_codon:yes gene_type:complete
MLGKALSTGGRFAGNALTNLFKIPGTNQYMSKGDILFRLMPDAAFGVLEGTMTPGDIGDKLIAGTSTAVGGSMGGLALGRLGGKNQLLGQALDMAGSIAGDFGGRAVGEQLQRGKDKLAGGKGQSPYERLSEQDRQKLEQMIREDQTGRILAELGLLPASTQGALIS